MRSAFAAVLALLVLGLFALSALAADTKKGSLTFDDLTKERTSVAEPAYGTAGGCDGYAEVAKTACEQAVKAAFDHHRWKMEYTRKAYEAHHIYTLFVFVLVCALVLLGMWLSYREFQRAGRKPLSRAEAVQKNTSGQVDAQGGDQSQAEHSSKGDAINTLEVGSSGVKVSSPVLGVIVLIVSMVFFYLYLKTVYPIEEAQPIMTMQSGPPDPAKAKESGN